MGCISNNVMICDRNYGVSMGKLMWTKIIGLVIVIPQPWLHRDITAEM